MLHSTFIDGIALDEYWDTMTGLEQASAILDTVKYLDGIAALEHDEVAAADKKCGPSVRWVNLESPVSPKAFIMNIVHICVGGRHHR